MTGKLNLIYKKLYSRFGPQHWWPGKSAFEIMVGAILTQNTNWQNVEKAIDNLKRQKLLQPQKLRALPQERLAALIRPAGYYNVKARRLKYFLNFLFDFYGGKIEKMRRQQFRYLRRQLLAVNGIGAETADSILLYALKKPIFVIDAYTRRMLFRHGLAQEGVDYDTLQNLFMRNLKNKVQLFNEYHALLVKLGKDFCLKRQGRCDRCPLK